MPKFDTIGRAAYAGRSHRFAPTRWVGNWLILIILLAACSQTPTPQPSPTPTLPPRTSAWGTIEQVGQAEHGAGPAVYARDESAFLVWTGAQENEARLYGWGTGSAARILALKAYYPFDPSLFYAGDHRLLLWLDRSENGDALTLLAGVVSLDAVAQFGPNPAARVPARRYSAVQLPDGLVRVVFSSGEGILSNLYLNHVDVRARSRPAQALRPDADYPALVLATDGAAHLYWLQNRGRDVYHARFDESTQPPALTAITHLTSVPIQAGDAIEGFSVAFDESHAYLFWNVRRVDGSRVVLLASGAIDAATYPPPRPFGISSPGNLEVQTTFNSGYVLTAEESSTATIAWAAPLAGQHTVLPVAVNQGDQLGVAYFRDGVLLGYQDVTESGALIGPPAIATERNRHLYLTWAEATLRGYANLYLTTTRR